MVYHPKSQSGDFVGLTSRSALEIVVSLAEHEAASSGYRPILLRTTYLEQVAEMFTEYKKHSARIRAMEKLG